ncbi:uncharacterized protein LOC105831153 isoform X1 [Monomorium pharaonis]|uniref:uncharacterized protein LOC105831153 isoform X1 n=1 Tax=Monomorium pharaonis TaxID=307658 RepID=UPI001746DF54|nr:uncharacterized protein LOC105831153 isoform X1 [Monomorium pharaonis]
MARVICNDLGNPEAVTFIFFFDNKQNVSTHKRFLQTANRIIHGHPSNTTLKWGLKLNDEKTPNAALTRNGYTDSPKWQSSYELGSRHEGHAEIIVINYDRAAATDANRIPMDTSEYQLHRLA